MSNGKVVLVTGAGAGVGRAVAEAFGRRGAAVAAADVADTRQVEAAAATVESALGPIDVWVNNAMTSVFAGFLDVTPEEYERVTDVTYHGYVNGTRAALSRMVPRDQGVVVQVGSALAYRAIPTQTGRSRGARPSVRASIGGPPAWLPEVAWPPPQPR